MSDYKLVPVEPTQEMVAALKDRIGVTNRGGLLNAGHALANAIAAAPAVQGEAAAWVAADTVDGQTVNGKPRRVWWENNEGVGMPIYTAPQPVEQQPDVTQLVDALVACGRASSAAEVGLIVDAALAAYRKGGEV